MVRRTRAWAELRAWFIFFLSIRCVQINYLLFNLCILILYKRGRSRFFLLVRVCVFTSGALKLDDLVLKFKIAFASFDFFTSLDRDVETATSTLDSFDLNHFCMVSRPPWYKRIDDFLSWSSIDWMKFYWEANCLFTLIFGGPLREGGLLRFLASTLGNLFEFLFRNGKDCTNSFFFPCFHVLLEVAQATDPSFLVLLSLRLTIRRSVLVSYFSCVIPMGKR